MEDEESIKKNNVDQIFFFFFLAKIVTIYDVPDFPYVILFTPDIIPGSFAVSAP